MLEFEALYLLFESLFKNIASDMAIYNTPCLPPCRVISRLDFQPFEGVRFSDPPPNNGWITGP